MKNYWKYEKTITRKELMKVCWLCSIPIIGWIVLLYIMIFKPRKEKRNLKLNNEESPVQLKLKEVDCMECGKPTQPTEEHTYADCLKYKEGK